MESIFLVCIGLSATMLAAVGADFVFPYEYIDDVVVDYKLPELPYTYKALEPYIDAATLKVHHAGHHAGYTKKLNAVLKTWREQEPSDKLANGSIIEILEKLNQVPEEHRTKIRNVGGGYVNHNLYFSVMSQPSDGMNSVPVGQVASLINKHFGSFARFKEAFTAQAKQLFGSGYVWLSQKREPSKGDDQSLSLILTTSTNQDAPMTDGLQPILILDVWEHAYYLKHQNKRDAYIDDWWNVVDWQAVQKLSDWWLKRSLTSHDEL